MKIVGIQKLTLLDYEGLIACILFTNGCNFACPYCQNSSLVINSSTNEIIPLTDVYKFLISRKEKLDGVVISGGEPLLQDDIIDFIKSIKELGFKVKLDTNGYFFNKLKYIVDNKLVDYIAMDIKNSLKKYAYSCGVKEILLDNIKNSISLLKEGKIPYEFRTTIIKEYHTKEDIIEIADLIKGCNKYYLQQFKDSGNNIKSGLHAHDEETLIEFKNILLEKNINTFIKGL